MNVAVNYGAAAGAAFRLHGPESYSNIVEHTESIAVVTEGVVRAAGEVCARAVSTK